MKVIGVDEHVWTHTRRGDTFGTVIIDLTAIRDGIGTASGCLQVRKRVELTQRCHGETPSPRVQR